MRWFWLALLALACLLPRPGSRSLPEAAVSRRPRRGALELSGQAPAVQGLRHYYVVGCGHSGTTVVKRTLSHLPGMHCIPRETQLFFRMARRPNALRKHLARWDAEGAAAGFSGWVEKTPKHVQQLSTIWKADPQARVVFIVRDGRDVAASMMNRGLALNASLERWVVDNSFILPHLGDPRLLTIKYEEFADEGGVLPVLRRLADFVGAGPVDDDRLLLALQPPTEMLPPGHQCAVYEGEEQKEVDLRASRVRIIGEQGQAAKGDAPRAVFHNSYRSWQVSVRAWTPQLEPVWPCKLSPKQQALAASNSEVRSMLQRFGYSLQRPDDITCLRRQNGSLAGAAAVLDRPSDGAPLTTA